MITKYVEDWLREDGWGQNLSYWRSLPKDPVVCVLNVKSDCLLSGIEWFEAVFEFLEPGSTRESSLQNYRGKFITSGTIIPLNYSLSWATAISGERLALNLLQRASSVATMTHKFVNLSKPYGIRILDTRKTTPGLRELEKSAVLDGGGYNHRFQQTDSFMIKDNHKTFFGSLTSAVEFFRQQHQPYKSLIVEVHVLSELQEAQELGVTYFMLDNFSPRDVEAAIKMKRASDFFEVSGGLRLETLPQYCLKGVDAFSIGSLTQFPLPVDLSFKFSKK
jgi:nicotinate-nucleotide pyrophosphorylase (carboxylating)